MKGWKTFMAVLLAACCITTIAGLVPTLFWRSFFDYVIIEGLKVGEFMFFGHVQEGFVLFESITIRTILTFGINVAIVYFAKDFLAPHATTVILAWCFPLLIGLEVLFFEHYKPDGFIFECICNWMSKDDFHRAAWLWTLTLWLESIVVEFKDKAFTKGHIAEELLLNTITSLGVGTAFYLLLDTLSIEPFSRTAYALLPIMALHQFALAKRKSIKSKKPAAPPAAASKAST